MVIDDGSRLAAVSDDFRFSAAVAGFGMLLRGSEHVGDLSFDQVVELAQTGLSTDRHGHRAGFLDLVGQARELQRRQSALEGRASN